MNLSLPKKYNTPHRTTPPPLKSKIFWPLPKTQNSNSPLTLVGGVGEGGGCKLREETVFATKFPEIPGTIWSTSEGWKAELTLEPPSSLELETPGLGIQRLSYLAIARQSPDRP